MLSLRAVAAEVGFEHHDLAVGLAVTQLTAPTRMQRTTPMCTPWPAFHSAPEVAVAVCLHGSMCQQACIYPGWARDMQAPTHVHRRCPLRCLDAKCWDKFSMAHVWLLSRLRTLPALPPSTTRPKKIKCSTHLICFTAALLLGHLARGRTPYGGRVLRHVTPRG